MERLVVNYERAGRGRSKRVAWRKDWNGHPRRGAQWHAVTVVMYSCDRVQWWIPRGRRQATCFLAKTRGMKLAWSEGQLLATTTQQSAC